MVINLIETLNGAGKETKLYQSPDGSRVLILPYGGRVLGLFSAAGEENFFWTHPALAAVETARAFYQSGQWHNSGGDRTWLSPEVDLFFPEFPRLDTYWQPRQLDPGDYQVVKAEEGIRLNNRLNVKLSRSQHTLELEMIKWVNAAPNPLRHERYWDGVDIEYAGYQLQTSLLVSGEVNHGAQVGLWNLLQMPHGGDLLVPIYGRTVPRTFFGAIAPGELLMDHRLIRYRMRAAGEHKIGIRAVASTGRVGYRYEAQDRWALIIRNFRVDPSGEYIDVPWGDPEDFGYSTQACNVNSALGSFSELEYHVPAIGAGNGKECLQCDDASQVWAFRGSRAQIDAAAAALLGVEE